MSASKIGFNWNYARAFMVTAELGSFSAAANALKLSQPTLGRQVAALEASLSIVLFERTPRGLLPTPNGLKLLEYVKKMANAAAELELVASGQSNSLNGEISITVTEMMAAVILPPIIQKLRALHPGITVEIIASNSSQDLKKREADIALRAYRPNQQDLILRKVTSCHGHLYASRAYIDHLQQPITPDSLKNGTYIGFDRSDILIRALKEYGIASEASNFPIIVENHMVHWAMVKHGLGMSMMSEDIAEQDTDIVRVLPEAKPLIFDIWLVTHREVRTNLKIRTVYDFLFSELTHYFNDKCCNG